MTHCTAYRSAESRPLLPTGAVAIALTMGVVAIAAHGADRPATLPLDLAACVARAIDQSPGLLAAKEEAVAARWRYYAARSAYAPSLEADVSHREQGLPPPFLGPEPFGARKVTDESVTLTQPVYTFGRVEAQVHQRRQEARASGLDVETTRRQLVLDVKRAFFDALLDRRKITVVEESLEQAKRQLAQAQVSFKAGSAARYDVIRAEADVASIRPQVIGARHDYTLALRTLANLLSLDQDVTVDPRGDFDERAVTLDAQHAGALALAARPEVKELTAKLRAAREAVRVAQAGLSPTLSLSAAYDNSRGQRPPFDQSVEIDNYTVSLSVPLHDGGATHAHTQEARAKVRQIEHEARRLRDQVYFEVSQAILRLQEAGEVVEAAHESVRKSEEALSVASLGYRQGVRTAVELQDARLALMQARLTLLTASHDRAVSRATLERAIGQDL